MEMVYDNIEQISEKEYNKLHTDYKVEAVASNLLKFYNANANIFIKRVGINERPYLKDIKTIKSTYFGLDDETIVIETYRESIYDYLPEALFHPPSLGGSNKNIEKVVAEIKKQKEIEEDARNFFQPFELEFFYTEVAALLKETEFDVRDQSGSIINIVSELWPLLRKLDSKTAKTFFYILPFLHEVRGNKEWIERFLTAFNHVPVNIEFTPNVVDGDDDKQGISLLGNTKLGLTFIPSGKHMDGERNWTVNIGPIPSHRVYQYVSGHPYRDLLQSIYEYLMPISVKIYENFITVKEKTSFVLDKSSNSSRLGYTTFI